MPDHHNPTGLTMGDAQRREIVAACARAGVLVVADETAAELRLDGPPRGARSPPTTRAAASSRSAR
jgi:DNA-binding transcriptional MocR family regulator